MNRKITINVQLDNHNVPEKIVWDADDLQATNMPVKALILSLWDHSNKDTLRLDLWTKEMTRDEMKIFFYETIRTMADTLEKSVDEKKISEDVRDFAAYFAKELNIAEKPNS